MWVLNNPSTIVTGCEQPLHLGKGPGARAVRHHAPGNGEEYRQGIRLQVHRQAQAAVSTSASPRPACMLWFQALSKDYCAATCIRMTAQHLGSVEKDEHHAACMSVTLKHRRTAGRHVLHCCMAQLHETLPKCLLPHQCRMHAKTDITS